VEAIMEIKSAFNSGVEGFNNATQAASEAAANIARETTQPNETAELASPAPQAEPVNLTEEVVNLRVAEVQAQASANAIQTADETLGTLLDVTV